MIQDETPSLSNNRKVVQWVLAYLAGCWFALEVLEYAVGAFEWPTAVLRVGIALAVIGLPIAMVVAWYHGERGRQRVSGAELLIIFALLVVGGLVMTLVTRGGRSARVVEAAARSIAVLPFDIEAADETSTAFAEGMHDDLTSRLSRVQLLRVTSRTSVMGYRDTPGNALQVATELGVGYLAEGTVQRAGDQLRVTIRLIDPSTDNPVWSEQYDRQFTLENYFDVQSDIAASIASSLAAELSADETERIADRPTSSLEAWDAYQRGNAHFANFFFADRRRSAAEEYRQAMALDPTFADAFARLARTLVGDFWWGAETETAEEAWAALASAEAIDSTRAEVHLARGLLAYLTRRDYAEAERHYQRVLELRPSHAEALANIGQMRFRQGRTGASDYMDRAFELDPRSDTYAFQRGLQARMDHDGQEAVRWLDKALALNPQADLYREIKVKTALCISADTALARRFVEEPGWQGDRTRSGSEAMVARFRGDTSAVDAFWPDLPARDWRRDGARRKLLADRSAAGEAFADSVYEFLPDPVDVERRLSSGFLPQQPGLAFSVRGLVDALQGRAESAKRWATAGVAAMPVEVDPVERAWRGEDLLTTLLLIGDHDAAIQELEYHLTERSFVGIGCAQLDPRFDPLRGSPEFERVLADAMTGSS